MVVDVYYTKDNINGMTVIKAWDRVNSMYPCLFNQKYIGYNHKEIKELVQSKLDKIYKAKVKTVWHKQ